jgi:D-3-phosphoglycerate dehydrogenase / 2-oxoglutarate reductase
MLAARRVLAPLSKVAPTRTAQQHLLRCLSSTGTSTSSTAGPIPVDIEHYTSGWNIVDIEEFTQPGMYAIQTYDKISPIGLTKFPRSIYTVEEAAKTSAPAHALLMRSHKLQVEQVGISCRAIARCGAGTNNIPVSAMTEQGIPVFNTPGANANAVKELVLAGMLLGSRRIVDGINHMVDLGAQGLAKERVEKDKAKFGGREIKGKTLAVR